MKNKTFKNETSKLIIVQIFDPNGYKEFKVLPEKPLTLDIAYDIKINDVSMTKHIFDYFDKVFKSKECVCNITDLMIRGCKCNG